MGAREDSCGAVLNLGGDVEHTHLVKGLDFALLQKERMKLPPPAVEPQAASGKPPAESAAAKSTSASAAPKLEDLEVTVDGG